MNLFDDFDALDRFILLNNKKEHDEAEVNNEGKSGIWKPLGHIIGYMNHPYSEYFKCSLCGYEQYVIFYGPSKNCPNCKANMAMEQETKQ